MSIQDLTFRTVSNHNTKERNTDTYEALRLHDEQSGTYVNIESGLRIDAVYTAIKRVADAVAMTPSPVYAAGAPGKGRDKVSSHPVHRLLNVKSTANLTSYSWKHLMITHMLAWGNAFSEIQRDNAGRIVALNPMHPDDVKYFGLDSNGQIIYQWKNRNDKGFLFSGDDILHFRWMNFDGLFGISPIMHARMLMGREKARSEYSTRLYANGAALGGIITSAVPVTDEVMQRFRKSFNEMYRGPQNAGKILLLEGASKFDSNGITPADQQFIEQSRYDAGKISALFGVPSTLLNDATAGSNRASAEQIFLEFLQLGLNTILCNLEQQINVSLFTPTEQALYSVEFDRESLVRADVKTLIDGLKDEVLTAMLTPNEARTKLNMPPLEGGDTLLAPVNMVPIAMLGKTTAFQTPPAPDAAPKPPETQQKSKQEERPLERDSKRKTQTRSKAAKAALIKSSKTLLADAFDRIGTRERLEVKKLVKDHLRAKGDFSSAVADYYAEDGKFTGFMRRALQPIYDSTNHNLNTIISDQLDTDINVPDDFSTGYMDSMVNRYASSSRAQLQQVVDDTPEGEDAADNVDTRLNEWEQGSTDVNPTKAEKASTNEAYRMVNALARTMFVAGGVTKLVWSGGDCPLCQELDGKVVGTEENFADAGDTVGDMTVETDTLNPPLHQGCDCSVDPAD